MKILNEFFSFTIQFFHLCIGSNIKIGRLNSAELKESTNWLCLLTYAALGLGFISIYWVNWLVIFFIFHRHILKSLYKSCVSGNVYSTKLTISVHGQPMVSSSWPTLHGGYATCMQRVKKVVKTHNIKLLKTIWLCIIMLLL